MYIIVTGPKNTMQIHSRVQIQHDPKKTWSTRDKHTHKHTFGAIEFGVFNIN
jgi:hypothetical protein